MKLNLELPINGLSLGQVSVGVLREMFSRQYLPNIFPIGNIDLSAYNIDKSFIDWLQFCIQNAQARYSKDHLSIKIWHINGSERRLSNKQILWTPHETSMLTSTEKNIISNNDIVCFTSKYSLDIAQKAGLKNVNYCPNFFDGHHFFKTDDILKPNAITFSLIGKFEKRKNTAQILKLWAKLFGRNENYRLNCLINNPFLPQDKWGEIISSVFGADGVPWNINFIPFQEKNSNVNLVMNAADIDLSGLSGAEGFNLPCFHSLALDKVGVVLKAHAHLDYMDKGNSVSVDPSGTLPIYDGAFFVQGSPYNQGLMYSFDEEKVVEKIHEAIDLFRTGQLKNSTLAEEFSVKNSVDTLLSLI